MHPEEHFEEHSPVVLEGPKGHGRGRCCHATQLVTHEGRESAACLEDAIDHDAHPDNIFPEYPASPKGLNGIFRHGS